jgi:methionyl-tRNA formyltransferase
MGTPDFSVPGLSALIESPDYEVVAVVTQPDRRKGRGQQVMPPPVKEVAMVAGVPVMQPETLRNHDVVAELKALKPDVIIVAAFGQILRTDVLTLPPHGCLNIHASLLPRWRGASPVAAAIMAGDVETGVTLMKMNEGLDTGPMIAKRAVPIEPTHTRGSLTDELAELGARLLIDSLPAWLNGQIEARPQDDSLATKAPLLTKAEGEIDWCKSAIEIERHVRAFYPWPGTFTQGIKGQFKVLNVELPDVINPHSDQPGTVFKHQKQVYVSTGAGVIHLLTVQPTGKKSMPGEAMLNGQPMLWGTQLGN